MKYYAIIQDEKINGVSQCVITGENLKQIEITEHVFNNIERYIYKKGEIIINENYEKDLVKQQRKAEILDELDKIDLKTIRAIRANDTEFIEKFEKEAEILREELRGLE